MREAALKYLDQLPRFSPIPGVEREQALLEFLDHPEKKIPMIHVTGTNGKGSVSSMFAEVFRCYGLKVGFFSSPHLKDYPERINIQGNPVSWQLLSEGILAVAGAADKWKSSGGGEPTEFDVLTASAFWIFAKEEVDIAIIEVGIGGTYDSTNVIQPILTVITNIAEDHLDKCGPELADLAAHKAGILKPGVPMVSTVLPGPYREIIRNQAKEVGCPAHFSGEDWQVEGQPNFAFKRERLIFKPLPSLNQDDLAGEYSLSLLGPHQYSNAGVVLAGLSVLQERYPFLKKTAEIGLNQTVWPGRFEIIEKNGQIFVVDGAHNPLGAEALRTGLDEWFADQALTFVVGFLDDKEPEAFLEKLHRGNDQWIGIQPDSDRTMTQERIMSYLAPCQGSWGGSLAKALSQIQTRDSREVIVITGSLYLVGPARQLLLDER